MIFPAAMKIEMVKPFELEDVRDAWKYSRPREGDIDLQSVLGIDIPVNEFASAIFRMETPILIREMIVSLREHTVWARGTRVDDLSKWPIWAPVISDTRINGLKKQFDEAKGGQDQTRNLVPLAYVTGWNFRVSLRTFVKLAVMFSEMSMNENYDTAARLLFRETFNALTESLAFFPDRSLVFDMIESGKFSKLDLFADKFFIVPERDAISDVFGIYRFILPQVPISFRAQIVRHRPIIFRDNLSKFFSVTGLCAPQSETVDMTLAMTAETALGMVRKRNCWMAQTDIWDRITKLVNTVTDGGLRLPCDHGICPYTADNRLRIEAKDPNPPCPRYANLMNEPLVPNQAAQALTYAKTRPDEKFWTEEAKRSHS